MAAPALVRIAAAAAVAGTVGVGALGVAGGPAAGASEAGAAEIVSPGGGAPLRSGGSRTDFRVKLPSGAACKGDSARAGYRIQGYLVPSSADLDALAFDSSGPVPAAGQFRAPLHEATFSANPFVDQLTAEAVPAGGPGVIVQPLPAFSFASFDPAFGFPLAPGEYNVGVACTLGPPGAIQQDKRWNTVVTITPDPADVPARIRWAVTNDGATTTTRRSVGWAVPLAGAAAVAAAGGGVIALRRRRHEDAFASPHPTVKETP